MNARKNRISPSLRPEISERDEEESGGAIEEFCAPSAIPFIESAAAAVLVLPCCAKASWNGFSHRIAVWVNLESVFSCERLFTAPRLLSRPGPHTINRMETCIGLHRRAVKQTDGNTNAPPSIAFNSSLPTSTLQTYGGNPKRNRTFDQDRKLEHF